VERVNSPYLQVYPDIGNITNAAKSDGSDVLEDLERGRGHLAAMHLKETVPGVFREVPFGTGHVDFDAAIAKAWALGVRRYVTEMWYTGSDTWQEDVRDANRRMTEILDRQV
jgi:L-ribulose-5-phosphate 3-epimerase